MKKEQVRELVLEEVYGLAGRRFVPVAISNRHLHISRQDLDYLFGKGYQLHKQKDLSQPGQYAAGETVTIAGPKGEIGNVRILGPERGQTQVEISMTDAFRLGIKPAVRMSGDLKGTSPVKVRHGNVEIDLPEGLILSRRHLHISGAQAQAFGLRDGDVVRLRTPGARSLVFEEVLVRSGDGHELEVHLDTDEANAAGLSNGDLLEII